MKFGEAIKAYRLFLHMITTFFLNNGRDLIRLKRMKLCYRPDISIILLKV